MLTGSLKDYFLDTLNNGKYNLLFGAGVSLDSENIIGEMIPSGEDLRRILVKTLNANPGTPLSKLASNLNKTQINEHLTKRYTVKKTGDSMRNITKYVWRDIFTFNIDNVLEQLYTEALNPMQIIKSINYVNRFTPVKNISELQIIHLHGFVQQDADEYVFSLNDYVRLIDGVNPWMTILADLFASEPFILAGVSLNEPDLEYYFSKRNAKVSPNSREPTILIEPFPDSIIKNECNKNNIILVESTIKDFFDWVFSSLSNPKGLEDLTRRDSPIINEGNINKTDALQFYSDFQILKFTKMNRSSKPSTFFYGAEPTENDINQNLDIERGNTFDIYKYILQNIMDKRSNKLYIIKDEAYSGKTTFTLRLLERISANNINIIKIKNQNRIDKENTVRCLKNIIMPTVIWIDNITDRMNEVNDILEKDLPDVYIIGVCRNYRFQLISDISIRPIEIFLPSKFTPDELKNIINNYDRIGLTGDKRMRGDDAVMEIINEPIGIAICRIMNDYRPLNKIVYSLINDSEEMLKLLFLYVSLIQYCYPVGIKLSILQSLINEPARDYIGKNTPLVLVYNKDDPTYIKTQNEFLANIFLDYYKEHGYKILYKAMIDLSKSFAPYVNRETIKLQTPEARASRRLLNFEDAVSKFISDDADEFYSVIQAEWDWNSRYWEQRALGILHFDMERSLRYARHAVSIEEHPYTLNTLATVLHEHMKNDNGKAVYYFEEIIHILDRAITKERTRSRVTVYPLTTLLSSVQTFLRQGNNIDNTNKGRISDLIEIVLKNFSYERRFDEKINDIKSRW
jgi:hypothetical protein